MLPRVDHLAVCNRDIDVVFIGFHEFDSGNMISLREVNGKFTLPTPKRSEWNITDENTLQS
jgi:hypothetical protein